MPTLAHRVGTTDFAGVEMGIEDGKLKKFGFREVNETATCDAVLETNTFSRSISEIASNDAQSISSTSTRSTMGI